jgi:hypothetical protein
VVAETKELGAGEIEFIDDPPRDIHRQQGIGGHVFELVLFGRDPDATPRTYFDPETGAVTYASSARLGDWDVVDNDGAKLDPECVVHNQDRSVLGTADEQPRSDPGRDDKGDQEETTTDGA